MSEYEELWGKLTHDQKGDHVAALEHLTAKYGDKFGDQSTLEMRLLKRDPELTTILAADPPGSKPQFDRKGRRLDSPPAYFLVEKAGIESEDRISLADTVQWVISRGEKITSEEAKTRFDGAVDEVLSAIAENRVKARGQSGGELKKVKRSYCGQDFEDLRQVILLPTPSGLTSEINIAKGDEFKGKRWVRVTLPSARVLEVWQPVGDSSGHRSEKQSPGAKRKFNREKFKAAALNILHDEGGIAPANGSDFIQSDLERRMADWCQSNFDQVPGERWVRLRCSEAIEDYYRSFGTNTGE